MSGTVIKLQASAKPSVVHAWKCISLESIPPFFVVKLNNQSINLHPGSLKSLAVTVNATVFLCKLALAAVQF